MTSKTTFIKFKEPKTLAEALNWVKNNYADFETVNGYIQLWRTAHCAGFKKYLDYINGTNFNGKKIYRNTQADWNRNRFANTRITHFAIHEQTFGNNYHISYELFDKYGYEFTIDLPGYKNVEIENLEI